MSVQSEPMALARHAWLSHFEQTPVEAFGDLLAGYADIHPYERADPPDAARMLFGPLKSDDNARKALGPAIVEWLEKQRKEPLPAARPKLQRRVREISEAFETIALLNVADAAAELRQSFVIWNEWVARLALSSARDARAEFWRMLALTQPLVANSAADIDPRGLEPMWRRICREAGGRLPRHYLSIGLLGLRRLPEIEEGGELPWVSGLAQWAMAQQPSDDEFKAEWFALKPLYPRASQRWRKLIAKLLSAPTFREADIEAPAWWHVDPDFAPMVEGHFKRQDAPLRSPMPEDCNRIIGKLDKPFKKVEPLVDDLLRHHRHYLHATGDAQYFVRAIHSLGCALIERGGDSQHARNEKAQSLAREGLKWQPYNRYLWSLWRDALAADGALEAAELVGWEKIRRDPTDVDARNQLAIVLANLLNRYDDAELLLKETIEKFPEDGFARSELAELLIFQDRVPEASSVLDEALEAGIQQEALYAARSRIYAHDNRLDDAMHMIKCGLDLDTSYHVLQHYKKLLSQGELPPLKSQTFRRVESADQRNFEPAVDVITELGEVARRGTMRRLRFQLEVAPENNHKAAVEDLKRIFREDPTFAYAELLAARHRLWTPDSEILPSFAAAFEEALTNEDQETLEKLAIRQPRLEALILVARALLGDEEAAKKVEEWLHADEATDSERAVAELHSALRPVLRLIEGGRSTSEAFNEMQDTIIGVLHDANEAALGENFLVA